MRDPLGYHDFLGDFDRARGKWARLTEAFESLTQVIFLVHDLGAGKTDLNSDHRTLVDRVRYNAFGGDDESGAAGTGVVPVSQYSDVNEHQMVPWMHVPHGFSWREVCILDLESVSRIILAAEIERVVAGDFDAGGSGFVPVPRFEVVILFKVVNIDVLQSSQVDGDAEGGSHCETSTEHKSEKGGNRGESHFDKGSEMSIILEMKMETSEA